ncbi:MAG TPA: DUF6005 family protein [Prosthecobacter sp.]
MKTREQIIERIYTSLASNMKHLDLSGFQSDARLREDLGLDSSDTLELLVSLEVEYDISLPESAIMENDFSTVRAVAQLLFDAQPRPATVKMLETDQDIKLHCFVSCLSEVIKRLNFDQRTLYFGVWDSEIIVTDKCAISYHSERISHQIFNDWYERLYGIKVEPWFNHDLDREENIRKLVSLVENRTPDQHIMVMLDMHRLPERVNEFNKDPFPHYLMLGPTEKLERWFVYDPDYRWEGVTTKERLLHAARHPAVGGGYLFSDKDAHEPYPEDIRAYFEESMFLDHHLLTEAVREIVEAHLKGYDKNGEELPLSNLRAALDEVPILAIRKYAYEHGFAFFWREIVLEEEEFDDWCDVIDELAKAYTLIKFHAIKLATTGDRRIGDKILEVLDKQVERESRIKARMQEVFEIWCERTFSQEKAPLAELEVAR